MKEVLMKDPLNHLDLDLLDPWYHWTTKTHTIYRAGRYHHWRHPGSAWYIRPPCQEGNRATGCMPGSILCTTKTDQSTWKGTSRPHTRGIIGWPPCQNLIHLTEPHVLMVHIRVTMSHFLEKKLKNFKGKINFWKFQGTSIVWIP